MQPKALTVLAAGIVAVSALGFVFAKHKLPALPALPGSVIVAVIDTGVDATRLGSYSGHVIKGQNLVDARAAAKDLEGHGTEVARRIAERCDGCRLLPLKITDRGSLIDADLIADAINQAVKAGARVINCSFGVVDPAPAALAKLRAAVSRAESRHAILVTAAGVGVKNPFEPAELRTVFPQALPETVVVGTVPGASRPSMAGNFGPELDISLLESSERSSSFAAGAVSGLLAKLLKADEELSPAEARHWLRTASSPSERFDPDRFGFGILDPKSPVEVAKSAEDEIPVTVHRYAGHLDISSVRDIVAGEGAWSCKGVQNSPSSPVKNALAKGRMRIDLAPAPAKDCILRVRLSFGAGRMREITVGTASSASPTS